MAITIDGEKTLKNNKQKLVHMINIEELDFSDVEHKEEVIALSKEATRYLNSFSWCEKIVSGALAEGFGYIICIFLFYEKQNKIFCFFCILKIIPGYR